MEAMFRGRAQRIQEKLSVMQGRREAIDKSLLELELSRMKLNSSRMLSQDREKLSSSPFWTCRLQPWPSQPFPTRGC